MTKTRLILMVALAPAVALAGGGASVLKAQDQPATAHAVVADGQSSPLEKMGKAKSTVMTEMTPQILGVIASNGQLPFTCDDVSCWADLSTFCLQRGKENPERGQPYVPVDGAAIFIRGDGPAGQIVRLTAGSYVRFSTDRGFTAVEASLSRQTLAALNLGNPTIEIGESVSLLPAATNESSDGQAAAEVALATGSYREKAADYFDRHTESADAIRLTNQMINTLPAHGRSTSDSDGRVLEAALTSEVGRVSGVEGVELARVAHDTCGEKVERYQFDSMRSCLEAAHDQLVAYTNIDFWRSLAPGY